VVLGRHYSTAALRLADGPELDVATATIDSVDVVCTTVAGEGAFLLTGGTRIVPAIVL